MPHQFTEIVDLERIKALLSSFYELTAIPSAITDSDGAIIVGVGWRKLCSDFHRAHPETAARCTRSDILLSRLAGEEMRIVSRQCLNGLIDVAVPITIDGEHAANLFLGQFAPNPLERDFFIQQAQRYGFDLDAYLAALDKILPFDWEKTSKEIGFLSQLAGLIGEMGLDQMKLRELAADLEYKVEKRTVQLRGEIEVRRRTEKAMRKTLSEFETIFNNSSVGIFYIKKNRIIHRLNNQLAAMLGYMEEDLVGKNTRSLFPDDASFASVGNVYESLAGSTGFIRREVQLLCKNGEPLWCSLYGKAVDPANVQEGVIWVVVDISESKEFETLREDVDAIMRHDLKVPINGIIGLANTLQDDANLTTEQRETIELIIEAGYVISNQINQSLELLKLETGRYVLHPAPVNIELLIDRVVRELTPKTREKGISIHIVREEPFAKAAALPLVQADEMLSYTMLSNLVDNAVDATPAEGEVTVLLSLETDYCTIAVRNPSEVPQEIRTSFFEKFVTTGKSCGTGLGTYSARLMAEAQQGDIEMESSSREGTTVRVRLPL